MKIKKAILFRQQRKLYKKKKSNVTVLKHKTQGFPGNRQHYSYQCLNILPIKNQNRRSSEAQQSLENEAGSTRYSIQLFIKYIYLIQNILLMNYLLIIVIIYLL